MLIMFYPWPVAQSECDWKRWVGRFAKEGLDLNY